MPKLLASAVLLTLLVGLPEKDESLCNGMTYNPKKGTSYLA
jgi:hypothetical protein